MNLTYHVLPNGAGWTLTAPAGTPPLPWTPDGAALPTTVTPGLVQVTISAGPPPPPNPNPGR